MADPGGFLHALAQSLSVMALYPSGHPSRERAIDQDRGCSDRRAVDKDFNRRFVLGRKCRDRTNDLILNAIARILIGIVCPRQLTICRLVGDIDLR